MSVKERLFSREVSKNDDDEESAQGIWQMNENEQENTATTSTKEKGKYAGNIAFYFCSDESMSMK